MAATDTPILLDDGPWTGMVDSLAPTSRQQGKYLLGQNIYPLDPAIGDGVVGRPGVRVMGAQLGAVGRRRVQGVFQFTKKNGTEFTIAIVGGFFYTLDWVNEVWTEVLTTAQLTAAAITLDQTAKIQALSFTDKIVFNDGVNTPWAWDGTAGAGLTKLTNAPVFAAGSMTVYFGRLLGIKASDPVTFVWSETDVLNTGYEAGGFNNAWALTQTDPNRLYTLLATNDGVYVLRARSGTTVGGDVTAAWSSSGTRDALSETEGTMSPFATILHDVNLVMLDADLRPQLLRPGGAGFEALWTPFRETIKKLPRTPAILAKCMAVVYTPAQLILFAVPDLGATECTMLLVYDAKSSTPVPVAIWRGWEMTALGMVKSQATASLGTPYLFHGDTLGRVYLHGNPEDSGPWDDFLSTGTAPISHTLECQALGFSTKREKLYDRIDVSVRALTRMTLGVAYTTPRGQTGAQTIIVDSGVAGWDNALWDTMTWDVDTSLSTQEAHGDVGIDVEARWIKPKFTHATLNEQFGLVALTVLAYGEDDDPEVP